MIFNKLISILIGTLLGTITGLTPGIHINLISIIILSLSQKLLKFFSLEELAIIIVSMAITHTFLDTIPSIFLGAPEEDSCLSALPGHKMLLKGKGYEAVILTLVGSISSLILSISLLPILSKILNSIYPFLQKNMLYILVISVTFLILKEKKSKRYALTTFFLAGTLGVITLTFPLIKQPLFPLLSGLFGTSMLILSYNSNIKIPEQKITKILIDKKIVTKALGSSIIAGSLCSFLPGLGPSQAAIIGSQFTKKLGNKGFLILVGALNTINIIISFLTLYKLNKARNGAVVIISQLLEEFTFNNFLTLIATTLIVGFLATFLTINISKVFSKLITKINYKILCISIISLITILVIMISGPLSLLILITATFIGMIPQLKGIGRNHLMGCLLLPVILYFSL